MLHEFYLNTMHPFLLMDDCIDSRPPTLSSILVSLCDKHIPLYDLAEYTAPLVFDFDYPSPRGMDKHLLETMILNHFMNRRIGQSTFTMFKIMLRNRLHEIMPYYRDIFKKLEELDIDNVGGYEKDTSNRGLTTNSNEINSVSDTNGEGDNRFSDTPENHLQNVKNGEYISEYTYNTQKQNNVTHAVTSGDGSSEGESHEKLTQYGNKLDNYIKYTTMRNNIFERIYSDLEVCFLEVI